MPRNAATFDVVCSCGEVYHAEQTHIGSYIRCRKCGQVVQVRDNRVVPAVKSGPGIPKIPSANRAGSGTKRPVKPVRWIAASLLIAVAVIGLTSWATYSKHKEQATPQQEPVKQTEPPLPAGYSEVPADQSTPKRDLFSDLDYKESSAVSRQNDTTHQPRRPKDPGVDIVVPIAASIDVLDSPDSAAAVVLTASASDPLAVLLDSETEGWFHVLHIPTGKTGWLPAEAVKLSKTRHPKPAPQFGEEFTGSDGPPRILIHNKTGYDLTVTIRDSSYKVRPHSDQEITERSGTAPFQAYVAAPDVIPLGGKKDWAIGHKYDWTFWIEHSVGFR